MEISDQIIKVLDDLANKIGISIDWTSSNIIPYLQELFKKYIQHEIWTSIFFIVVGAIAIVAGLIIHRQLYINKEFGVYGRYENRDLRILAYIALCIMYFIGGIMVLCQIHDIITCIVFPERFVIKELLILVK